MARKSSAFRTVLFAALALVVALGFLARRTGLGPGGPPAFDPAEFAEVVPVTADRAGELVGRRGVVCGLVANALFASGVRGQPTYLNLDRPFPDQPFDAVIWGRHRAAFDPPPEVAYRGRRICVAGRVTEHRGVPRIEVSTPAQIRLAATE